MQLRDSTEPASTATGSETASPPSVEASDAGTGTGSELRLATTELGEVPLGAAGMTRYMYDPRVPELQRRAPGPHELVDLARRGVRLQLGQLPRDEVDHRANDFLLDDR